MGGEMERQLDQASLTPIVLAKEALSECFPSHHNAPVTWAESVYQALVGGGKNGTMLTMPWGVSQLRPCPGVLGGHLDLLGQEQEIQSPPHQGL